MDKIEEKSKPPESPEDKTISTIFMGGITEEMTDEMFTEMMEKFGKIERMRLIPRQKCGFICFYSRDAAEKAIATLHDKLYVMEKKIKLLWAKTQLLEHKAYKKKSHKDTDRTNHGAEEESKDELNKK